MKIIICHNLVVGGDGVQRVPNLILLNKSLVNLSNYCFNSPHTQKIACEMILMTNGSSEGLIFSIVWLSHSFVFDIATSLFQSS